METSNYNFTDSQKESCAVSLMRDTVEALSLRDNISYEEALLRLRYRHLERKSGLSFESL